MTDFALLEDAIKDSGMTMTALSVKTGIRRETLYNRFKGIGDFTALEITALCSALHLKKSDREAIFFASNVE